LIHSLRIIKNCIVLMNQDQKVGIIIYTNSILLK